MTIDGSLCHAARALTHVSRDILARASGVSAAAIESFERGTSTPDLPVIKLIQAALEDLGAVFIPEDHLGQGVRLKFTKLDVKQIRRLEGEGGAVGDDDV